MTIQHATIGVIGFGNFGKVVCSNLFADNPIVLFSKKKHISLPKHITQDTSVKELVEKANIIIPCVPIRNFEETIKHIAPFIRPKQIVMDICSVKEYPTEIMKKHLPTTTQIIATHPLFGPNSLKKRKNNTNGLPMVIQNVSASLQIYEEIKRHMKDLGIRIVEMTPTQHDQLSANSQFFALCIGEIAQHLQLRPTSIDTPGAKAIFHALGYMGADRHIIEDMVRYNRFCGILLPEMIDILSSIKKGPSYA